MKTKKQKVFVLKVCVSNYSMEDDMFCGIFDSRKRCHIEVRKLEKVFGYKLEESDDYEIYEYLLNENLYTLDNGKH